MAISSSTKVRTVRTNQKKPTKFKPQGPHKSNNQPRTSAKPTQTRRENLTLFDWLQVLDYVDDHPDLTQPQIVRYCETRSDNEGGSLKFSQGTLSKKLKPEAKEELRQCAQSHPDALSGKQARIVTRPDVEKCLILWVEDMECRGETVSGPMLVEKRQRIEEMLEVPDEQRLTGTGWITSFKKACVVLNMVILVKLTVNRHLLYKVPNARAPPPRRSWVS
ncbi:hypothetical protein D9758_010645 [Tetrapyrgos nigripes]|uniref:HTH CENPB-type domain-containing protein n=1 Tax=Tetrapyrgos nigripes TaxID=182062 RepID=A0A8H5LPA7_9AGAR|nr:hypothetical protein D9758_010645 [Tetrapyrgos nigripes]